MYSAVILTQQPEERWRVSRLRTHTCQRPGFAGPCLPVYIQQFYPVFVVVTSLAMLTHIYLDQLRMQTLMLYVVCHWYTACKD